MSTPAQVQGSPSGVADVQPLPAQSLHWIVFVFLAAFGAICITLAIAMLRVAGMDKFRGFHVISFPVGERIPSDNANERPQSGQTFAASLESQKNQTPLTNYASVSEIQTVDRNVNKSDREQLQLENVAFESRLKSENCGMAQPTPDDLTYVRSQPAAEADILVGVPEGKETIVVSNEEVFVQVELPDGTKGWVYKDRILPCSF